MLESPTRPPIAASSLRRFVAALRTVAADIKLLHSVFALPFAILGAFMAAAPAGGSPDWGRFAAALVLVIAAMIFARTVAMLANRLIDREIDARNPRTAGRALPAGRVSSVAALGLLLGCGACFLAVCVAFGGLYGNWWPAGLGVPVLLWISAYAWLKRFTALCHLYLGSSLAISPLAAALAVDPASVATQPALWLLSGMVFCWVAGFDVIYALQDLEVDRAQGLFSLPSRLGPGRALWVSRLLHLGAAACLIAALRVDPRFATAFGLGVAATCLLLLFEHATVARWGTSRIALAFFTLNGLISCLIGALGVTDILTG